MSRHAKYPLEIRERAIRMVLDHGHEYGSQWEAICSVAEKLGPKAETVRLWVRQVERDQGSAWCEHRGARRAQAAQARERRTSPDQRHFEGRSVFLRGGARPPIEEMIRFIDDYRDHRSGGVEVGYRADLCSAADRPVQLPRCQEVPSVGSGAP